MGKNLSVTPARYKSEFPWLKEVDSLALCNAQMHHFFHDVSVGLPKFRSKKKPVKSYTTNCVNGNTVLQNGRLKLPKAGWVRIRQHRKIEEGYQLKGATITQEADERYYVALLYSCEEPVNEIRKAESAIGLDFSMKITYDPATKTLIDTEWIPGFGQVTDKYHYAGINEMGYTVFECKRSNRTAISGDSYIYFSGPGVMAIETEEGYENLKKQ